MTDTAQDQERVEDAYEAYKWLAAQLCIHLDTGEEEAKLYPRLHLIGDVLESLRARQREDREDEFVRGLRVGVRWGRNLPDDEDLERACEVIESRPGVQAEIERLNDATSQREGEREPVAWRVRYRRIGRGWTWFRLHADKAKAVQDVENLIQNYKSVSYAEAVPLYTEPPAERESER